MFVLWGVCGFSFWFLCLFSGKTYLEMLTVGGSYASITVEVTALSGFLRFLPHIAAHIGIGPTDMAWLAQEV